MRTCERRNPRHFAKSNQFTLVVTAQQMQNLVTQNCKNEEPKKLNWLFVVA